MENQFTAVMAGKSTKDLMKVIELKADYQPEAVAAAEQEILRRKQLLDSGITPEDTDNDFVILKKFRQSTDDELVRYYTYEYNRYSKIEIDFLKEELAKRNLEPRVWFYSKGDQKMGPVGPFELKSAVKNGTLSPYDYIWRDGMQNWLEAGKADGLFEKKTFPPPVNVQKPYWIIHGQGKQKPVGVSIAAVLMFLTVPVWISTIYGQFVFNVIHNDSEIGFIPAWNIAFTFISIVLGIGILKQKKWGYDWGVRTAIVNMIILGMNLILSGSLVFYLLALPELAIAALLLANRDAFVKKTEEEVSVYV